MELDPQANIIRLHAKVIGPSRGTWISVALDTGATFTTIPSWVAQKLGYDTSKPERWNTITGISRKEELPMIRIKAVEVLGTKVEDCWVGIHDLPDGARIDGLLGLSYLRYLQLLLDMPAGFLNLEPSSI